MKREEALQKARELELDLIEISATANPPVAKIMDYGNYLYQQEKKLKQSSKKVHKSETKEIQIGISTSEHDLKMKAKRADEFLKLGDRVRIDLILKGRSKYLDKNFIEGRFKRILQFITEKHRMTDTPKRNPRGLTAIIEKEK